MKAFTETMDLEQLTNTINLLFFVHALKFSESHCATDKDQFRRSTGRYKQRTAIVTHLQRHMYPQVIHEEKIVWMQKASLTIKIRFCKH